jgi:hypothetical protein
MRLSFGVSSVRAVARPEEDRTYDDGHRDSQQWWDQKDVSDYYGRPAHAVNWLVRWEPRYPRGEPCLLQIHF